MTLAGMAAVGVLAHLLNLENGTVPAAIFGYAAFAAAWVRLHVFFFYFFFYILQSI